MLKTIYDFKASLLSKDMEELKDRIKEQHPDINVQNNNDRTIRIDCDESRFNEVIDSMDHIIPVWAGSALPCISGLVYDIFPLNKTAYLLKV